MKKISVIFASLAVVFAMTSCDKMEEPYFNEPSVSESDTIKLEASDTVNFDGKVVVLLEDYTGIKCVNCPNAAVIANELEELNEGHLVVLGVHPRTSFQDPGNSGLFPDFRTDDGETWRTNLGIGSAFPSGLVNRTGGVLTQASWTSAVGEIIGSDAPVRLIIKSAYDDATRELRLSIHSKFLQPVESNDLRLTICMMEDSITGRQVTPSGLDTAYVHRHVFRGTADGLAWGRMLDPQAGPIIEAGRNFITNIKFNLSENYNDEQFYIVAFINDNNTNRVLMSAKKKIK